MRKTLCLSAAVIVAALSAGADDGAEPEQYSTFLVPIYFEGPGAHMSFWTTEFWIQNRGEDPVESEPFGWYNDDFCGLGAPCPLPIPGGAVVEPPLEYFFNDRGRTGLLYYPALEDVGDLSFSLRVKDIAQDGRSAGVEIPVVPGAEFRDLLDLLNVPSDARFRSTLRVYATGVEPVLVDVLYRSMASDEVLAEEQMLLVSSYPESDPQYPLSPQFAELAELGERVPLSDRFRIEL